MKESINPPGESAPVQWLSGGGEMGKLIQVTNWANTPLGPIESWPQSLCTALSIMLASRFAMVVAWGPEFRFFYNDRYRPVLGTSKHPSALGSPAKIIFPEAWPFIGPLFESTRRGESVALNDELIPLDRNGHLENCYFTLSYSPIRDETGGVGGMLAVVAETTERVEGERRLKTLRDLARRGLDAKTAEDACANASAILGENYADVPFSLFYLLDTDGTRARLVASSGLDPGVSASPMIVELTNSASAGWPLAEVAKSHTTCVAPDLLTRVGALPGGPYPEKTHTAVIVPLIRPGQTNPDGIMIFGVSPRRALDDLYHGFYDLAADHILTAIRNALAHQEEKQRAEALAEIDRAKTAFFSNVSHEFRTPLTLMLGPLEDILAQPKGLSTEDRERLEVAHRNSLRLLKLVNTLLDFSRIEAGRIQASYESTDLAAFTADLASVFRSTIERAGLRLVVNCPKLSERVYVDREMWEKITLNLLSNAFKFTFEGEIEISLRQINERVELAVIDTGTGIPAEEIPHLFERFYRAKGARGRTFEGSGIGLALVHELVKLHSGTVRVESEVDRGSCFIVSIPFGKAHLPNDRIGITRNPISTDLRGEVYVEEAVRWLPKENAELSASAQTLALNDQNISETQQPVPGIPGSRPRVLVADDNADMREYVRLLLSRHYEVEAVANGLAAIRSARERTPDLVLTDVMMPELDGFGLLKELRAEARTATVPVIMLSVRAGEEARVDGMQAGADDYLIKPFSVKELLARVESHLALSRLRRGVAHRARESEERMRLAMEAGGMASWDADLKTGKALWSENYFRLLGYEPHPDGNASYDMWLNCIHPDDREHVIKAAEEARLNHKPYNPEHRIIRADNGGTVWLSVAGRFLYDEAGEAVRLIGVFFDIAERKRMEEELLKNSKLESIGVLAGGIAHDFNNLLTAIIGNLYLCKLSINPENKLHSRLVEAEKVCLRAQSLTQQLLTFARGGEPIIKTCAIGNLLNEWVTFALRGSNVEPRFDVQADLWPVEADESQLNQVIHNLVINAQQAMAGGGTVIVKAENVSIEDEHGLSLPLGRYVKILIADQGIGIPKEHITKVFDPFFTTKSKGSGLGLTTSHSIVSKHKGYLTVESEPGRGTAFSIYFPASTKTVTAQETEARIPLKGKGDILFMDDEEAIRESIGELLQEVGYKVKCVSNGSEAILQYRNALEAGNPFDIVILDLTVPSGMGGKDTIKKLLELDPEVNAIVASGYSNDPILSDFKKYGFVGRITKPYTVESLSRILSDITLNNEKIVG